MNCLHGSVPRKGCGRISHENQRTRFGVTKLLWLTVVVLVANQKAGASFAVHGFVFSVPGKRYCPSLPGIHRAGNIAGAEVLVPWLRSKKSKDDYEVVKSATTVVDGKQQQEQQTMVLATPNDDANEEWIRQMMDYLSSKRDAIFRNNTVAMILSSSPPNECQRIASRIAGIGSQIADELYFVVSPQDEEFGKDASDASDSIGNTNGKLKVIESIDFDEDFQDTSDINVVILSTKSPAIIHDDPFVNDFLRYTDAWIHMGSEFADAFCLHARLQEGANITLWGDYE